MNGKPLKIMYFSPVAGGGEHDRVFADMARDNKLPGTEVHIASLPAGEGGFTPASPRARSPPASPTASASSSAGANG